MRDTAREYREAVINYLTDRDGRACRICKKDLTYYDEASIDHVKPVCKGGKNELSNFRLVHRRCNRYRGKRPRKPIPQVSAT